MTYSTPIYLKIIKFILLVSGIVLVLDCLFLLVQFKINFGTVVPFLIGIIFIIHALYWQRIQNFINTSKLRRWVWGGLWAGFLIWLLSFIAFAISLSSSHTFDDDIKNVKAVIVLGGGVKNNKPTPTLASRLDTAAQVINQQPQVIVVPSGGIGIAQELSEGEVMKTYLTQVHGINEQQIIPEEESTSTEENLLYSQPILEKQGVQMTDSIAIVTSDFHIPRSIAIAKHQGYTDVVPVSSPTPLNIRYNAWFREYFAYISGWLLGEY